MLQLSISVNRRKMCAPSGSYYITKKDLFMFETRLSAIRRDRILNFSSSGKRGFEAKTIWANPTNHSNFPITNTII